MVSEPHCNQLPVESETKLRKITLVVLNLSLEILSPSISTKDLSDHHVRQLTSNLTKFDWRICKNSRTWNNSSQQITMEWITLHGQDLAYWLFKVEGCTDILPEVLKDQKNLMPYMTNGWQRTRFWCLGYFTNCSKHKARIYAPNNSMWNMNHCCSNTLK